MDRLCECGHKLISRNGNEYGYWGDKRILFKNIPIYICSKCEEVYLDIEHSILLQEMTMALSELNEIDDNTSIDMKKIHDKLILYNDSIYNLLIDNKLSYVFIKDIFIINNKDVESLDNSDDMMIAARNCKNSELISELLKEIEEDEENER